jgi:hypothetical protein
MLGNIIGNIVNIVAGVPHLIIILFHNFILLVFILGFFYGIFRLCQNGWRKLRGRGVQQEPPESAPKDESKNGGE